MKKYFAKYLPIEDGFKRVVKNEQGIPVDYEQEVKLFLCSREVKIGQECYVDGHQHEGKKILESEKAIIENSPSTNDYFSYFTDGTATVSTNVFRAICPISELAEWIKENDEFDDEEVKTHIYFRKFPDSVVWVETIPEFESWLKDIGKDHVKYRYYIKIICPTCKTFH